MMSRGSRDCVSLLVRAGKLHNDTAKIVRDYLLPGFFGLGAFTKKYSKSMDHALAWYPEGSKHFWCCLVDKWSLYFNDQHGEMFLSQVAEGGKLTPQYWTYRCTSSECLCTFRYDDDCYLYGMLNLGKENAKNRPRTLRAGRK